MGKSTASGQPSTTPATGTPPAGIAATTPPNGHQAGITAADLQAGGAFTRITAAQSNEHQATRPPDATIAVARFNHKQDTRPQQEALSWPELCERLTTHDERDTKDGPLFSPAVYRPGATRANDNVTALTAGVLDFDHDADLDYLRERAAGYAGIIYTTHSHTPTDPRYRLFMPLARPVPVDQWPGVWQRLNRMFGCKADRAAKDQARMHYLPACPPHMAADAVAEVLEGAWLDPDTIPAAPLTPEQWAEVEAEAADYAQAEAAPRVRRPAGDVRQGSVIDAYNEAHSIEETLERYGYKRKGRRFVRPGGENSSITILDGTSYHHNSSDPLHTGHRHDAFGVFCHYQHNGSIGSAVKEAARELNIPRASRKAKTSAATGTRVIGPPVELPPHSLPEPPSDEIPEPALVNDRGVKEYDPAQVVKLLRPGWDVVALTTHAAHAHRIEEHLGSDLCYCPFLGWLLYNGRHWEKDDKGATKTAARVAALSGVVRAEGAALYRNAATMAQAGRSADAAAMSSAAAALLRHAKQAETKSFIDGALHLAAGRLCVGVDRFDQQPWIIGFQDATWDSGHWREHRRGDFLLHLSPVTPAFDDQREWLAVLARITQGDADFARSLQDTCGYILSAASHLRFLPFLYGPKGTGKSTVAELLQTVLGDMSATVDPKLLQDDAARERLGAALWNRRLAICSEAGSQRLEAETLKTLSGADKLSVRFLYHESFTAPPRHVLLMVANDPPRMDAYDDALKDRVTALPLVHPLAAGEPLTLTGGARIEAVRQNPASPLAGGFAAWALEGLARVFETQTIHRAACLDTATKQFWDDTDPLTPFWESLPDGLLQEGISKTDLRKRYEEWCIAEGARPFNRRQWARACSSHGLEDYKGTGGMRFWRLKAPRVAQVAQLSTFPESSIENLEPHRRRLQNQPDSATCATNAPTPAGLAEAARLAAESEDF